MKFTTRAFLWVALLLATTMSGFAQGWAIPASTPDTTVTCVGCPGGGAGLPTVGYKLPISGYTGRFLDSSATTDYQATFRTARADQVRLQPARNRIFFRYGSTIASYNLSSFFTRLESREQLWPSISVPVYPANARDGAPEVFLKWDEWFTAEYTGSGWTVNHRDGQQRIVDFDIDDDGYVYIAASLFGWGIVKDGGTTGTGVLMANQFQRVGQAGDPSPFHIMTIRGASKTYAFVSGQSAGLAIWDATNRKSPTKLSSRDAAVLDYAKLAADRAAIVDSTGSLSIGSGDDLANGTPYTMPQTGYKFVATDGTNIYALRNTSDGLQFAVITPSGSGWTERLVPVGIGFSPNNLTYGGGYLVMTGNDASGAWDMELYKVTNTTPAAFPTLSHPVGASYFKNYYSAAPAGYAVPQTAYINITDGTVYPSSDGKTYLFVCAKGLGDVYLLAGSAAAINATSDGPAGTINPYAPAASNSKVFYGDPAKFTATSSSNSVSNVQWSFGNPEARDNLATSLIGSSVTHQYSHLGKGGLGSKTVTASSITDTSVKATTSVNLEAPTASFALYPGTKYLFKQPNASSAAPIVSGDLFVDTSDGRVEGHYSSWTLDGQSVSKGLPSAPSYVGPCGSHTMTFQAFYGPYTGSASTLTTDGSNYIVGIDGATGGSVGYTVRPFAAAIELAGSDAASLVYMSVSRFSSDALSPTQLAAITYDWKLVDGTGGLVKQGPQGVGSVPQFTVLKSDLSGHGQNLKIQLTLTSPTAPAGSCSDMTSSVATSAPLNVPNFTVAQSGTCAGSPCTFTVTPAAGIDPVADAWRYNWEVLVNGVVDTSSYPSSTVTNAISFTPGFTKAGTYDVRVTVANAIGAVASTPVRVVITTSPCKPLTQDSFRIVFSGQSSGCTAGTSCNASEPIDFYINVPLTSDYDTSCGTGHTYTWTFSDTGSATTVLHNAGEPVTHAFSASGTAYCTVNNGTASQQYQISVTVAGSGGGGGGTGGGGGGTGGGGGGGGGTTSPCGTMSNSSIFLSYIAPSGGSGCSSGQPSKACNNNESLTFNVEAYSIFYTFSCANHTFKWSWGDGTPDTTTSGNSATPVAHTYTSSGSHTATLTIISPYAQFTRTIALTTQTPSGGGGGGGNSSGCPTIKPNLSLYITYHNGSGTCSPMSTSGCAANEQISFTVGEYQYDSSCGTHTWDWDFGDGSAHATTRDATHQYTNPGSYTVKCNVTNGGSPVTLQQPIQIGGSGGGGGTPVVNITFESSPVAGFEHTFQFTPKVDVSGQVASWFWNFGDGKTETRTTTTTFMHTYEKSGSYTVTVTGYDSLGRALDSYTQTVVDGGGSRRRSARH